MKQKTKRLLAGLGIGLALGSSAMLTGCSSDITFNQKDLDNVINNVNTYLENTQNNNSEYVRNNLNELIINGMNNSIGIKNIAYNVITKYYENGLLFDKTTISYKRNIENNTLKVYYNTIEGKKNTNYIEATRKSVDNTYSYDVEEYKINSENEKTYVKQENLTDISSIVLTNDFYADYVGVYSSIIAVLNDESLTWNDFIKSTEDDVVTYKCTALNSKYIANSSIVGNLILQFKNNKITMMELMNVGFMSLNYSDNYSKVSYVFDYENETISFDKSGFNTDASSNN